MGFEVVHRNTRRIKFNITFIINSELSNENKIFNEVRRNKNIIFVKRTTYGRKGDRAGVSDR
jgi:hypothetical protein